MKDALLDALAVSAAWAVTVVFLAYLLAAFITEQAIRGSDT